MDKITKKEHAHDVLKEYIGNARVRFLSDIVGPKYIRSTKIRQFMLEQLIAEAWGLTMVQE